MKGWTGLLYLVLASVLTVSGILFAGIEYYRAHPIEPNEMQNFTNMLFLGFMPFVFFLIFRYSRVKISEREFDLEYRRRFPEDFSAVSPIREEQKSAITPLSPPSPQTVNTGGVSAEVLQESKIGESGIITELDIESAVIDYIRLNNGLKFKDQSAISRIGRTFLHPIQNGTIDRVLFSMHKTGKLIIRDDILYLSGAETQAKSVKIEPISSVQRVDAGGNRGSEAILLARIVALISQIYPDPAERKEQINFVTEAYRPAQYPEVIKQLSGLLEEQKAEQIRERKRLEILEKLKQSQNQPELAGTAAGHNGTVKKLSGTGLRQDWDNLDSDGEQEEEN